MNLTEIIGVVKSAPFYNVGEATEIAKGKYYYATTFKDNFKQLIRTVKYKK